MKRKLIRLLSMAMALCLLLSAAALADTTYEGDANVDQRNYPSNAPFIHPPFYNVKLKVTVGDDGKIVAVEDNGTGGPGSVQEGNEEFWANKNKAFFEMALNSGLLDKFVGKTLDEVKAMDTLGADAVSGATMAGDAMREAVVNALEGRAGKTFLPVEGPALAVESIGDNKVVLTSALPEDFDLAVLDIRWSVYNAEADIVPADSYAVDVADGKLTLTFDDLSALKPGYYYVNVVDQSGKYRSPAFEGGLGDAAQAAYFVIDSGLTEADIAFDGAAVTLNGADIADYLRNIEHVLIQEDGTDNVTEQEIVGHHGTVGSFIALTDAGALNADGVVRARDGSETPLFRDGVKYTVTIAAFGYPTLTFPYEK